jgi:2-polyprenyl-3-methyl-5-hydroxy-6-metoxy-1,4-benzoquinol methylase
MKNDKAGKAYWDEVWTGDTLPLPVDPSQTNIDNYVNVRFHEYFSRIFSRIEPSDKLLLEVGCANSSWLPYFSQQFGFKIYGLDYSEIGCEQSREILSNAGIQGEIVCADFFSPPTSLLGKFDVVVTFGVVEHFTDTQSCIKALSKLLKPGGLLITNIPNMVGLIGTIEKMINRPVYDIHVPLDVKVLDKAHKLLGLEVLQCDYFLSTHFGVLNLNGLDPRSLSWKIKKFFLKILLHISKLVWLCEDAFVQLMPTRLISPYINCLAQKQNE